VDLSGFAAGFRKLQDQFPIVSVLKLALCLVRNLNRHYQDACHAVSPVSPKDAVFEPWTDDRSSQFLLDQMQNTSPSVINYWLLVTGTWLDYDFPIKLGISSSQLTIRPSFFRGVGQPPTR
jgi:hypothetical protein